MVYLLAYSLVAVLTAVSFAAPNPAVNRIDAPNHKPHSSTVTSSSTAPHVTIKPREPAVNRIDAVGVKPHHVTPTSSSARPYITLNPRDPAINRIDVPAHKPHISILTRSAAAKHPHVEQRAPAMNRVDAVGNGAVNQALFSVEGGTPVTLAVDDIRQLEAAA